MYDIPCNKNIGKCGQDHDADRNKVYRKIGSKNTTKYNVTAVD